MMTAILMSGRTSAAFAANLGAMQVNDEVSALQTLGIPPLEFLVVPRIVALSLMMPLHHCDRFQAGNARHLEPARAQHGDAVGLGDAVELGRPAASHITTRRLGWLFR
jgi:hypothetical protein